MSGASDLKKEKNVEVIFVLKESKNY